MPYAHESQVPKEYPGQYDKPLWRPGKSPKQFSHTIHIDPSEHGTTSKMVGGAFDEVEVSPEMADFMAAQVRNNGVIENFMRPKVVCGSFAGGVLTRAKIDKMIDELDKIGGTKYMIGGIGGIRYGKSELFKTLYGGKVLGHEPDLNEKISGKGIDMSMSEEQEQEKAKLVDAIIQSTGAVTDKARAWAKEDTEPVSEKAQKINDVIQQSDFGCQTDNVIALVECLTGEKLPQKARDVVDYPFTGDEPISTLVQVSDTSNYGIIMGSSDVVDGVMYSKVFDEANKIMRLIPTKTLHLWSSDASSSRMINNITSAYLRHRGHVKQHAE